MRRLLIIITLLILVGNISFGDTNVKNISPNTWITAESPSEKTDAEVFNDNFKDVHHYDFAPYYTVYRLPVTISDYTIYMKHPGGTYKNILVSGTNPLKGNSRTYNYYDVQAMESFFLFFQQPYLELPEGNIHATRINFSIHPESDSRNLYLIAYFESPNDSFEFMIKSPADPVKDVEDDTNNPYAPYLKGYYWGNVHEMPLYLSTDNSVNPDTTMTSDSNNDNNQGKVNKIYSNTPSEWAIKWIDEAIAMNIIPIDLRNNYNKPITRLDFVKIYVPVLEKLRGINYPLSTSILNDTNNEYAKIAVDNRIIPKYSGDLFYPNNELTREKASFYLYAGIKTLYPYEKSLTNILFSDVKIVEPAYLDSLFYWVEKGVYSKFSDGRVDPKRVMTREEFYVTVLRIYKLLR